MFSIFLSLSFYSIQENIKFDQKAVALYGVELKTAGGHETGFTELDFDLAVSTRSNHDKGGDVELSVLGVDLKLGKDKDTGHSTVSRLKFSVQFSIPQEQFKKELGANASKN